LPIQGLAAPAPAPAPAVAATADGVNACPPNTDGAGNAAGPPATAGGGAGTEWARFESLAVEERRALATKSRRRGERATNSTYSLGSHSTASASNTWRLWALRWFGATLPLGAALAFFSTQDAPGFEMGTYKLLVVGLCRLNQVDT
jgi:hypothetical protein